MIKINQRKIENLAQYHFLAISNFLLNARKKNRLEEQNKKIKAIFGEKIDFRTIVLAKPNLQEQLIQKWDSKFNASFSYFISTLYSEFSYGHKLHHPLYPDIEYNALYLMNLLDIKVCPYCNRNFIFNTDKKGKRTCDIDHFFPKKKFPFLAVSFFNLIPSCKSCNQLKLDKWNISKETFLINPYDDRHEFKAKFKFDISDSHFYHNSNSINIKLSGEQDKRTKNQISAFHIDKSYSNHKDYVLELIQKKYIYNESYLDELYKKYEGHLFKKRTDLIDLISSNYITEAKHLKRPLSKLNSDISYQLKFK